MQKTTTYCDVCGDVTVSGYALDFKWCNAKEYSRLDICKNCKNEAGTYVTAQDKEEHKSNTSRITYLGLLRLFAEKKKLK